MKFFKVDTEYAQEKDFMVQLTEMIPEHSRLFMSVMKYDDENQILFYESGICSLDEVNKLFIEKGYYWYEMQPILKRLICQVASIFIGFLQKGIYHSDLKPNNIVFYFEFGKISKRLKIIDFGCCTTDFSKFLGIPNDKSFSLLPLLFFFFFF